MADRRNTELAQILNRQPAQNLPINVVVTEHGLISLEPKAAEPFGHFHMSRLETASLANHYNSDAAFCPGCVSGVRMRDPPGRDGSIDIAPEPSPTARRLLRSRGRGDLDDGRGGPRSSGHGTVGSPRSPEDAAKGAICKY